MQLAGSPAKHFWPAGVSIVWRWCGDGVPMVWRGCGESMAMVWRGGGEGVARVWRWCGDGVARVWRRVWRCGGDGVAQGVAGARSLIHGLGSFFAYKLNHPMSHAVLRHWILRIFVKSVLASKQLRRRPLRPHMLLRRRAKAELSQHGCHNSSWALPRSSSTTSALTPPNQSG